MSLPTWMEERIKELGRLVEGRLLNPREHALARSVFAESIPYDRVVITNLNLGGAVTLVGPGRSGEGPLYTINWVDGYLTTQAPPDRPATLIHELTHVWQGYNGVMPALYMGQSAWAQLRHGIEDILKKREWRGWNRHRGAAYDFSMSDIGKPWSAFNVEQQGSLVESWFMPETTRIRRVGPSTTVTHDFGPGVYGGGRSEQDPRFPYIRDVIRARNRHAAYRPLTPIAGSDPAIRSIQDKLVALGYLEARHADGTVGRANSPTLDAVAAFQRRNGLAVDRNLGGPNSETRRKLAQPTASLVRWQ